MSLDLESRQANQRKAYIDKHCEDEPVMIVLALRKKKLLDRQKSLMCQVAWMRKKLAEMRVKEFKTPSPALCLCSFGLI